MVNGHSPSGRSGAAANISRRFAFRSGAISTHRTLQGGAESGSSIGSSTDPARDPMNQDGNAASGADCISKPANLFKELVDHATYREFNAAEVSVRREQQEQQPNELQQLREHMSIEKGSDAEIDSCDADVWQAVELSSDLRIESNLDGRSTAAKSEQWSQAERAFDAATHLPAEDTTAAAMLSPTLLHAQLTNKHEGASALTVTDDRVAKRQRLDETLQCGNSTSFCDGTTIDTCTHAERTNSSAASSNAIGSSFDRSNPQHAEMESEGDRSVSAALSESLDTFDCEDACSSDSEQGSLHGDDHSVQRDTNGQAHEVAMKSPLMAVKSEDLFQRNELQEHQRDLQDPDSAMQRQSIDDSDAAALTLALIHELQPMNEHEGASACTLADDRGRNDDSQSINAPTAASDSVGLKGPTNSPTEVGVSKAAATDLDALEEEETTYLNVHHAEERTGMQLNAVEAETMTHGANNPATDNANLGQQPLATKSATAPELASNDMTTMSQKTQANEKPSTNSASDHSATPTGMQPLLMRQGSGVGVRPKASTANDAEFPLSLLGSSAAGTRRTKQKKASPPSEFTCPSNPSMQILAERLEAAMSSPMPSNARVIEIGDAIFCIDPNAATPETERFPVTDFDRNKIILGIFQQDPILDVTASEEIWRKNVYHVPQFMFHDVYTTVDNTGTTNLKPEFLLRESDLIFVRRDTEETKASNAKIMQPSRGKLRQTVGVNLIMLHARDLRSLPDSKYKLSVLDGPGCQCFICGQQLILETIDGYPEVACGSMYTAWKCMGEQCHKQLLCRINARSGVDTGVVQE